MIFDSSSRHRYRGRHHVTRGFDIFAMAALVVVSCLVCIGSPSSAYADGAVAHIGALSVRDSTDGTAPFDVDSTPGNDASPHDGIVRSFDTITYLLEYTTLLNDPSVPATDAVVLELEVELDESPEDAVIDPSVSGWAESPSVTYVYEDGSTSSTWDHTQTVVRQVWRARRTLSGKGSDDRVPGAGQLSVGIGVKSLTQGDIVQPRFSLHVQDDDRVLTCSGDRVRVSSKGRFNIKAGQGFESKRNLRYVNYDTGAVTLHDDSGQLDRGRIYGDAFGVGMWNTTPSRGLRGLELPTGDITFDIRMTATLDGRDVSVDPIWGISLWDYNENVAEARGALGRVMSFEATQTCPAWGSGLPTGAYSKIGTLQTGVHDSGTWHVTPDADDPALLHVRIDGYDFDKVGWTFPKGHDDSHINSKPWADSIAYFTIGHVQTLARVMRVPDKTYNYSIRVEAQNLRVTTESGDVVESQQVTTDDALGNAVTLYGPGTISKYTQMRNNEYWSSGKAWGYIGGTQTSMNAASYSGTEPITAADQLVKFDDAAYTVASVNAYAPKNSAKPGVNTIWYAAKPDGSGWASDVEMNDTHIEGLVYYPSLAELMDSGSTCVGVLLERRDGLFYAVRDSFNVNVNLAIRPTATPGYVAQSVHDMRAWWDVAEPGSVRDFPRGDGSFGLGDATWGSDVSRVPDSYAQKPKYALGTTYEKSRYENGVFVGGHKGGAAHGDSCLLIGGQAGVSISVADMDGDVPKSVYDLDASERVARFRVSPKVTGTAPGPGARGTAKVIVDVPKGLSYIERSANIEPASIEPTQDGTRLTFEYDSVQVNVPMLPIEFSCEIGDAGTDEDVKNNQQLEVSARITSSIDQRAASDTNGLRSSTSIRVVRLAAISVFKSADLADVNAGDQIAWTLRMGNSSNTNIEDVVIADVMPYDGDSRGSRISMPYRVHRVSIDLGSAPSSRIMGLDIARPGAVDRIRDMEPVDVIGTDDAYQDVMKSGVVESVDGRVHTYEFVGGIDADELGALRLHLDRLSGGEHIAMRIEGVTRSRSGGDILVNDFHENAIGQAGTVTSNTAPIRLHDVALRISKAWDDASWPQGRPDMVHIDVLADGVRMRTIDVAASDSWAARIDDLPRYADDGHVIEYSVRETNTSPAYVAEPIAPSWSGDVAHIMTCGVTNHVVTQTGSFSKSPEREDWL